MADGVASGAKSGAANANIKSFINPSFDIVKTIPQGIIELGLRGTGAVSSCRSYITRFFKCRRCSVAMHELTQVWQ